MLKGLLGAAAVDAVLADKIMEFPWIADEVREAEGSILDRLAGIASSDTDLANQVVSLPWLVDGVTDDERVMFTALSRISITDTALAKEVVALPWFVDDVTKLEVEILRELSTIASRDLELASKVASFPWFSGEIAQAQADALYGLAIIAYKDLALANHVVTLPWYTDGPTEVEGRALLRLNDVASEDIGLAKHVAVLPWFIDGVTDDELGAIYSLIHVASEDVEFARELMTLPWSIDGDLTFDEVVALDTLIDIASVDVEFAREVMSLSWLNDGELTDDELEALYKLLYFAPKDAEFVEEVISLPWLIDGELTDFEIDALDSLTFIVSEDVEFAMEVVSLHWIGDGLTELESSAIDDLSDIGFLDKEFARTVISWPRYQGDVVRDLDYFLLYAFDSLDSELLGVLMAQPWFVDGLEDEEAALVVTLSAKTPNLFRHLLDEHHIHHGSVALPLAGEVNVWVVQGSDPASNQDVLMQVEETARIAEEFIGVPFPTSDIIVLVVRDIGEDFGLIQVHYGSHMSVKASQGNLFSISHETAHYYFTANFQGHERLVEGRAEFIEAQVYHHQGYTDLAYSRSQVADNVKTYCIDAGVENIRHNAYMVEREQISFYQCTYDMGENLLLNLFEIMGKEAMSSTLNELYVSSRGYVPALKFSMPPSDMEIYEAFLKYTPAQRQEEIRELFRRLHGGDFAFPEINYDDAEGDQAADAELIQVGETVEGSLDYIFDFDYFRFQADEGQRYRISVVHEDLSHTSIAVYGPDGVSEEWERRKSGIGPDGPRILWVASSSEEYYIAVKNFGGKTGSYAFMITAVGVADADDHGDTTESATAVRLNRWVKGSIDHAFDYDYFSFNVRGGEEYFFDFYGDSWNLPCNELYRADGTVVSAWSNPCDQGDPSEYHTGYAIQLVLPETGVYYLALYGFMESKGGYRFEIQAVD